MAVKGWWLLKGEHHNDDPEAGIFEGEIKQHSDQHQRNLIAKIAPSVFYGAQQVHSTKISKRFLNVTSNSKVKIEQPHSIFVLFMQHILFLRISYYLMAHFLSK